MAALHREKSSQHDVRTTQAALLPRVSLVGSLSRQKGAGANGSSDFDQDRIGIEVAIPLYQAGGEYSRIREASAIARQRAFEVTDLRMRIEQNVAQRWEAFSTASITIALRQDQIASAQQALEGVTQEQQYGTRTVLDVLDAERELFSARIGLIQAQRDRLVAAYGLAYALGQLNPAIVAREETVHAPPFEG
jgi:outer membrane protein TolC